jgi:glycosyltransferase involved in cell wall biosynthesis
MLATAWARRGCYRVARVEVYSGAAFRWAEAVCGLLRRAGKPYVLSLHGGNLPEFAHQQEKRVRALFAGAAAVTAPSGYLVEAMRLYGGDVRLAPSPLDLEACRFRARDRVEPRLVWLRTFHRVYNPALAAGVATRLAREFPQVRLVMCGPDRRDGSLDQTRRVGGPVTIAGPVAPSRVGEILQQGDIFLNTSRVDNTPKSVVEAMACGLCVVSTNAGGMRHLVEDGVHALLVPPDDEEAMAGAVRRLLQEPGLAGRLSRAGRERAEEFDCSRVLPQWVELLRAVAQDE